MHLLFDATSREAAPFAEQILENIDAKLPVPAILPTTEIVWNGTPLLGPEAFAQLIAKSPISKHTLTGLDVQPFPNGGTNIINMLVSISGSVELGDASTNNRFAFSAQLVVRRPQINAPLTVHTMGYRLVHGPAKPAIQF